MPDKSTPCFEIGIDFDNDVHEGLITDGLKFKTTTAYECWEACKLVRDCEGFAWTKPTGNFGQYKWGCWLKKSASGKPFPSKRKNHDGAIAGLRDCLY